MCDISGTRTWQRTSCKNEQSNIYNLVVLTGRRLGPYEIGSLIGAGGMGEVYRAHDTTLGRDVAIKILPAAVVNDQDRRARFEREARVLAALSHPHIAAIYGFEDRDGIHALILELVEGQTLADRLRSGAMPLQDALAIARQIADALDAAHDKGIVHRDLKPANILLGTDDVVKVLDFGLAKTGGTAASDLTHSPTITAVGTADGDLLGTAPYMSPEQARAKNTDKRTDIWAFGCVVYEMLAGRAAFRGDTVSDVLVAILDREPDWTALPQNTPPAVTRLLQRCLEKEPKRRLHDIADARIEIEDAIAAPAPAVAASPPRPSTARLAASVVVAALAGAALAAIGFHFMLRPAPAAVTRFTITLPPHLEVRDSMALSPDGRTLVYAATDESGSRLYRRSLDALESVPIRGSDGGGSPFFSPDGASVGFTRTRALLRVPVAGGAPTVLREERILGATWLPGDTIVFANASGLMRIPASGGEARRITAVQPGEIEHHSPTAVPGGRAVLFTVHTGARDAQRLEAVSLDTGVRTQITQGSGAKFLPTGHIVFAFQRSESLWAAPFDAAHLRLAEPPRPAIDGIRISDGWNPAIAVGANGSLAYATGRTSSSYGIRTLVWVDKTGREEPIDAPARAWWWPQISPDGRRLGLHIMDPANMDAWIYELAHGPLVRVTFNPAQDGYPVWTRDGKRIVYWSNQGGGLRSLRVRSADLSDSEQLLITERGSLDPFSWSADGKLLVFQRNSPDSHMDIGAVSIDPPHEVTMLIDGPSDEAYPAVSPDGRWIAYQSNQSGRWEVYVQPFPALGSRWQVSTQGGMAPQWDPAGRELFYRNGRAVITVPIAGSDTTFTYGNPRTLFEGAYANDVLDPGNGPTYMLSPDGRRFLMMKAQPPPAGSPGQTEIVVILNWADELQRMLSARP
jgi:serine/threonine-protein kinase